ncbi:hypothetical protein [Rhizobium leguminosarum]|uniref:hypothetical protein n=1 Tax=Rhizobium leguminosarum TaxID=384 RepID=UPI00143F5C59|nr:hypothetical protein [Rhizobium leguminosarum]NKL18475.1 hypothetical protein [Rhizobium leguminosarum bv. viciae]
MSESAVADDIGRIGEAYFDYQMASTNLLVGKIDPDRVGKDRVIEAKLANRIETVSFDKRSAPMACSIQIKTVLRTTRAVTVSLSVAERLAHGLAPAFVYVIRLDDKRKPAEIRVIHIIGPALGKILKRLRHEFSKGTTDLHKKSINFPINEATKIGLLGENFANFIEREIGPDMDEYAKRKGTERRELGYEKGKRTKVTGSIQATGISDFVDGMLGLKPLAVSTMKVEDERFGIALPDQAFPKFKPGAMAHFNPQPTAKCNLVLGPSGDGEVVETLCDVTFPPMGLIPIQYFKALLRSPLLEATLTHSGCNISTNPRSASDSYTVADWIASFAIIVGLSSDGGLPVSVQTPLGIEPIGVARVNEPFDDMDDAYTLRLLKALRALRQEARAPDNPVKLDDVFLMSSKIMSAQNSMLGSFRDDVTFDVDRLAEDDVPAENQVLFIQGFTLGDEHYVYCSSCAMRSSFAGDRMTFTQSGPLRFLEAQLLSDFKAGLVGYQRKMMRVSLSNVCVTYLSEGAVQSETTEVGIAADAAVDEPQMAIG